ncbi:MAG TPA: transcription termination/antitermination NusG family protein [Thermoanaerobaculia bacterium]|nr:transcription termination/antitermination NusG family protein [Thermoanaerobaculia bacterium]
MPLLKQGISCFPDNLFELPGEAYPWWVAYVRSRQEKALTRLLLPAEVPFYLPCQERRARRRGRSFSSYLPLFPGYVFVRGGGTQRLAALRSNLIVTTLPVSDQVLLTEELLQLYQLQQSGAALVSCSPLRPGDAVRIVAGPFQGYRGVVVRGAERPRLVVSISVLKKAVAVEFDREALFLLVPPRFDREIVPSVA